MRAMYAVAGWAALMLSSSCGDVIETREGALCCSDFEGNVRVMTLNLAHGRDQAMHQAAVSTERVRENLDDVTVIIERERIDVVGLQEADGASQWSGDFDHVEYLAEGCGFGWWMRGGHADFLWLDYGTAILGRPSMVASDAVNFDTFGPGFKKGFSVSTIVVDAVEIDVVSLHLDPMLAVRRKKQVAQLARHLGASGRLAIVMGDFNVEFSHDTAVGLLADELDLEVYERWTDDLGTFGARRLDWILITRDGLDFEDYYVAEDEVSDHRAVIAEISVE